MISLPLYYEVTEHWALARTGRIIWDPARGRRTGGRIVPQADGTFRYHRGWRDGRPVVDEPAEIRAFTTVVSAAVRESLDGASITFRRRVISEVPR